MLRLACLSLFLFLIIRFILPQKTAKYTNSVLFIVKHYWKYILLWFVCTVILFEIIVRVFFSQQVLTHHQRLASKNFSINGQKHSSNTIFQPSDVYFHQIKPNLDVHIINHLYNLDYHLKTNKNGFRIVEGADFVNAKGNIMILGDSTTLGVGVNQGEAFADRLQNKWLNQYIIHNFGTDGWSFAEHYLTYKNYAPEINPRLIIMGVYPINDFTDLGHTNWIGRTQGKLPQSPLKRSYLHFDNDGYLWNNLIRYRVPVLRNSAAFIFIMQNYIEPHLMNIEDTFMYYSTPLTNIQTSLQIVAEIAKETPVLILLFPAQQDYSKPEFSFNDYNNLLAKIDNVYVLNMYSILKPTYKKAYVDELHFTVEANQLIAEKIFEFVLENNLLGTE